jgi:hypothetical protein
MKTKVTYLLFWWHPESGCHHELTFDAASYGDAMNVAREQRQALGYGLALDVLNKHQCWNLVE